MSKDKREDDAKKIVKKETEPPEHSPASGQKPKKPEAGGAGGAGGARGIPGLVRGYVE